jgi:hypothetical protein
MSCFLFYSGLAMMIIGAACMFNAYPVEKKGEKPTTLAGDVTMNAGPIIIHNGPAPKMIMILPDQEPPAMTLGRSLTDGQIMSGQIDPAWTHIMLSDRNGHVIDINCSTGKIIFPPGTNLDAASKSFWDAITRNHP